MRICVLVSSLLLVFSGVAHTRAIHIQGSVFKDDNQNGSRDLRELGIPGIKIKSWGTEFYTDEQGKFAQTLDLSEEFGTLSLDEDLLPAGSIVTTASSIVVNRDKVNYSVTNFGISSKSKTFKYPEAITEPQKKNIKNGLTFEVRNNQLLLNDVNVLDLPRDMSSASSESITLSLDQEGSIKDKKSYEKFLTGLKKRLSQNDLIDVSTEMALPLATAEEAERLNQLSEKYNRELLEIFPQVKIKRKLGSDGSHLRIEARLAEKNQTPCRIYHGPTTFEVVAHKSYQVKLDKDERTTFEVHCGKKVSRINLHTLDNEFIAKVDQKIYTGELVPFEANVNAPLASTKNLPGLEIEQNQHLEKNRDQYAQFWIKSQGLRSFTVNGRNYRPSSGIQPYLHKGRPGKNTLRLSMIDLDGNERASKHEFSLFQQRRFYLSATVDSYDLRSRSSKFNFNYDIPAKKRVNLQSLYFFNPNWGVHLNHLRDISSSSTELSGGGTKNYLRTESQAHAIYRFKVFHSGYYAPVLHLYAGIQHKDSGLTEDVLIHYPKTFTGASLGGELFKENIFSPHLASSTALFLGHQNADNRTVRFSQEFRLNLNQLGKFFGTQKDFIYGPTYRGWNNVRLVLGMNYEMDEREADNADAKISDKTIAYRLGFAVQL